jgi:hypothetical protein
MEGFELTDDLLLITCTTCLEIFDGEKPQPKMHKFEVEAEMKEKWAEDVRRAVAEVMAKSHSVEELAFAKLIDEAMKYVRPWEIQIRRTWEGADLVFSIEQKK